MALGFTAIFLALLVATVAALSTQANVPIALMIFPNIVWLGFTCLSVVLLAQSLTKLVIDESGFVVQSPYKTRRFAWNEIVHIDRNGIGDRELAVHTEDQTITIPVGMLENAETARAAIMSHQRQEPSSRTINAFTSNIGTPIFLSVIAFIFLVLAHFVSRLPPDPKNNPMIGAVAFECIAGLLLLCILPLMYRLYISPQGVRKVFFWGAEKKIDFAQVTNIVQSISRSKNNVPISEVIMMSTPSNSIRISSTVPDFGWIRDLALANCKNAKVEDRRSPADLAG